MALHDPADQPPQEVMTPDGRVITLPRMCTPECLFRNWGLKEKNMITGKEIT
jgi:hypothetical protein